MSESSEITGPLITMIRQMGTFAERMNSGIIKSGKRYIHLHTPGTADILVCLRGRVIWLETKTEKGRTNPEQIENQSSHPTSPRPPQRPLMTSWWASTGIRHG